MTRRRRTASPAPQASPADRAHPTRDPWAPGISWSLLLVAIGTLAWLRAFGTWFSQDDFRWLLRAAEHTPYGLGWPRVLSMSLYFRAMSALAGLSPAAFHAVNVTLHVTTGLLLFHVMARRLPYTVAAGAAAVFLTSPALFDTLHWASAVADLLTGAFLALALWLLLGCADATSRVRPWLAVVAYALALASKEIAVGAAPVLALLQWRWGAGRGGVRAALTLGLAALFALPALGAQTHGVVSPYMLKPLAVFINLPAFVAAATIGGTAWANASDLAWARSSLALIGGWTLFAAWLTALFLRRSTPAWFGFAWFLGLLAPVLALENQVYFYYLYCALPGLVFSVACLVVGSGIAISRALGWGVAALVVAQSAALEARATSKLVLAPLPTDFVLRRATIARNAIRDLAPRRHVLGPRVVMLGQQPVASSAQGVTTTEPTDYTLDPWWDENVRAAISDGEALRLFYPSVRAVVFKPWLEPEDTSSTIVAYRIDGHLQAADYASFVGVPNLGLPATLAEHIERANKFILRRLFVEAIRELQAAYALTPDDAGVGNNLGVLQLKVGDSTGAMGTLTRAATVAPHDVEVLYNLGVLQWRLGREGEARKTWERLLAEAPQSDLAKNVRDLLKEEAR